MTDGCRLRTVALLARKPGEMIFEELATNPAIQLTYVITPARLPKAEGGHTAPTATFLRNRCTQILPNIKCTSLDTDEVAMIENYVRMAEPVDLLIVCNWRHLVPAEVLKRCCYAVNIHRGDLPKYPGARPILQALKAGDRLFGITAHNMTPELDQGDVIGKLFWQARPAHGETLEDAEKRIREEIEHMYVPLVQRVIARIAQ